MENMNNNILEIKNLHTYFYTDSGVIKSVDGVDIELREGSTLGIVGESGSGKSVTALSVMGLLMGTTGKVAEGEILFEGRDLTKLDDEERRKMRGEKISMIFQEPMTSLNPVMKIGDQITECILMHNNISRQEAWDKAVEMLKLTGVPRVERMMKEYPFQLSGGQRQRVMIAMALVCKPKILIADEPTTALDVTIQAQILDLMENLKQKTGTSILFITHDLGLVENVADRVYVMYQGEIVESGSVSDIFQHAQNPYTIKLLGYRNYGKGIGHTHGKIHFHNGTPHTHGGTHDHMHPRLEGDISHPVTKVEEKSVRDDQVVLVQEPEPEKLMEIQHLSKNFRLDRHTVSRVLDDFSLDIYRGEIVGVAGPSGCGKSTLARCIVGLYEPDGGQILYHGDTARIYRRQMIFQDSSSAFNPHMTLEEINLIPTHTAQPGIFLNGTSGAGPCPCRASSLRRVRRTAAEGSHCQGIVCGTGVYCGG